MGLVLLTKQERFLHLNAINPNECYPQNTLCIRNIASFFLKLKKNNKIIQNFPGLYIEIYIPQN